jgi:hypothetical protein
MVGSPPHVVNCNIAGGKYLYNIFGGFAGLSVMNTYIESLWSLGRSGTLPVTFTGTEININNNTLTNTLAPTVIAEGGPISFRGGVLGFFDNTYAGGLPFNVNSLSFYGTTLRGFPYITNFNERNRIIYSDVTLSGPGTVISDNLIQENIHNTQTNRRHVVPGTVFGNQEYPTLRYRVMGQKIDDIHTETAVVTSTATKTYFISSNPARYIGGELIVGEGVVDWGNDIYSSTSYSSLGYVISKNGDTVFTTFRPYGITSGTSYGIHIYRTPRFINRTTGNTTSGSAVISGLDYDYSTFQVGDHIKGAGIPAGARIISVGSGTLTMNLNATATATTVALYDAVVQAVGDNSTVNMQNTGLLWFAGDEIYNVSAAFPTVRSWYVQKTGRVFSSAATNVVEVRPSPWSLNGTPNAIFNPGGTPTVTIGAAAHIDNRTLLLNNNLPLLSFGRDGVERIMLGLTPVANGLIDGSAANDFIQRSENQKQLFSVDGGVTPHLTLSVTGHAFRGGTSFYNPSGYSSNFNAALTDLNFVPKKYVDSVVALGGGGGETPISYLSDLNFQGDGTSGNPYNLKADISVTGSMMAPTFRGSTSSGGNVTLRSTSHATKGKIFFGNSVYDEVNNRLGIGTTTPGYAVDVAGVVFSNAWMEVNTGGTGIKVGANGFYTDVWGQNLAMYTWTAAGQQHVDQLKFVAASGAVIHNHALAAKTGAYTITLDDETITADATGGAFTVTLPTAVGNRRVYVIKRINAGGNAVTVGTTSSQTIDGATTFALSAQWKYVTVQSDQANWIIIGNN